MRSYAFCERCFDVAAIIEHDGEMGFCIHCHTRFAFHDCQGGSCGLQGFYQQPWLPLVTPYISKVCPACGIAIDLGQKLESSSDPEISSIGTGLVILGTVIGAALLLDHLFGLNKT